MLLYQNFSALAALSLVLPPIFCPLGPVSGRSTQPTSWVYLPASEFQVISSFSLLREVILHLWRSAQSYVYWPRWNNWISHHRIQVSPLGHSGLSAVWIFLQTPVLLLIKKSTYNPNNLAKTGMSLYGLPDREHTPSSLLPVTSPHETLLGLSWHKLSVCQWVIVPLLNLETWVWQAFASTQGDFWVLKGGDWDKF